MTNKDWLATLSPEKWWETVEWLFHDYGRCYTDTRIVVIEWLNKEHKEQS